MREGDRPLQIASARQHALIALLALDANQVVSFDRLIDGLWGDDVPADTLNALRHHISRLRKLIGSSLVTEGSGNLLAVGQQDVDALRFAPCVNPVRRRTADPAHLGGAALRTRVGTITPDTMRGQLAGDGSRLRVGAWHQRGASRGFARGPLRR